MEKAGVVFFIVGAGARDVWLAEHGQVSGRSTRDVDLAVYVSSVEEFSRLKNAITAHPNFHIIQDNPLRIAADNRYAIDLLPFGARDLLDDIESIAARVGVDVDLTAFAASHKLATKSYTTNGITYQSLTMPGFVLSKLCALESKPEERLTKDLGDILLVAHLYADLELHLVLDTSDDLWDNDRDLQDVAVLNLGRQVGNLVAQAGNAGLLETVTNAFARIEQTPANSLSGALPSEQTLLWARKAVGSLKDGIRLVLTER